MATPDKCAKFGRYIKNNVDAVVKSINPIKVSWANGRISEISADISKPIDIKEETYECFGGKDHDAGNIDKSADNFGEMIEHVVRSHWEDMKFASEKDVLDCVSYGIKSSFKSTRS